MKMKYSKKVCAHDKIIVAMNAEKKKYLKYKISINGDSIGNICVRCHDSEELHSFGIP
jgi:hypothetical protein